MTHIHKLKGDTHGTSPLKLSAQDHMRKRIVRYIQSNNKGEQLPVRPCNLINAFGVRFLDSKLVLNFLRPEKYEGTTRMKPQCGKSYKQPPENICQTGFWQTRLVLLVDLESSNDLIYII